MNGERKIHIKKAPLHLQATANFLAEASKRNLRVTIRQTDIHGGALLTATDPRGKSVITGQLNPQGRLIIRQV